MTKSDFIKVVAEMTGNTQKFVRDFLDVLGQVTVDVAKSGEDVKIFDGITFSVKDVPERNARNPLTGETIVVPAKKKMTCKFGTSVKNYINE